MYALIKKDILTYFKNSLASTFLIVFIFFLNIFHFKFGNWLELENADLSNFFLILPYFFLFFIPALSMQVWTEEYRHGTLEILFSLPIKTSEIVISKFLAGFVLIFITLILTLPIYITASFLGNLNHSLIATAYIGIFLLALSFYAICIMCSTISKNPILSYLYSFTILLLLSGIGIQQIQNFFPSWVSSELIELTHYLSIEGHYLSMQKGIIDFRDVFYNLSIILSFLYIALLILNHKKSLTKASKIFISKISFLVILCLFLSNLAVKNIYLRYDLTSNKVYTLSQDSLQVVKKLKNKIFLELYYNEQHPEFSSNYQSLIYRIRDLFKQYKVANSFIDYKIFEYKKNSAGDKKLQVLMNSKKNNKEKVPPILIAINKDTYWALIKNITPNQEDSLELNISKNILNLTINNRKKIGIMSQLPVMGRKSDIKKGIFQPQQSWEFITLLKEIYEVQEIPFKTLKVPEDVEVLLLIAPPKLNPYQLYALEQFILKGKKLIAFLDSYSLASQQKANLTKNYFDLNQLTNSWGIKFVSNKAVVDRTKKSIFSSGEQKSILKFQAPFDQKILAGLKTLFFPHSGFFQIKEENKVKVTKILTSSTSATLINLNQGNKKLNYKAPFPIVLKVKGVFKSLFKNNSINKTFDVYLDQSSKPSEIFLFADIDFLFNSFSYKYTKGRAKEKISNNIDFLLNVVDYLSETPSLSLLRGRIQVQNKLDKLLEKRVSYAKKYEKEKLKIISEIKALQVTQRKLNFKKKRLLNLNDQDQSILRGTLVELEEKKKLIAKIDSKAQKLYSNYKNIIFLINLMIVPMGFLIFFLKSRYWRKLKN